MDDKADMEKGEEHAHGAGNGGAPTIAGGISIVGDIKGSQDLFINGEITGSIFLPDNRVQVGADADVNANITARVVDVAGRVTGDIKASDHVVIRNISQVQGDIVSPQIQLDEGCQFKGSVQMQQPDVKHEPPSKPRVVGDPGAVRFKSANG